MLPHGNYWLKLDNFGTSVLKIQRKNITLTTIAKNEIKYSQTENEKSNQKTKGKNSFLRHFSEFPENGDFIT